MSGMFPDLTVPKKVSEIEEWCKSVLESIEKYYSAYYDDYRQRDFENFNLFNGIFDKDQYAYVTDTYSNASPARLVNYPVMKHIVERVVGDFLVQPLEFDIDSVNEDAVSQKHEKKIGMVAEGLLRPYRRQIEEASGIELTPDKFGIAIPDNIDEFMNMTFRENTEEVMYYGIDHLKKKHRFQDIFKRGLYDLCITGKEFYRVDIVGGDPQIRRVDPRNIIYDIDIDHEDISKSEFVAEQQLMTVSEIISEYREWLTGNEIRNLEELRQLTQATIAERYDEYYRWFKFYNNYLTKIRVVTTEWRAHREVRVKVSENKYDLEHPFVKILPDDYKPKKGEKNIEYREIVEVWEATRIGPDIFVRMQARPTQPRREDYGYGDVPLSYVGAIKYNIDGRTISLVDCMKQIQILYNITMYNIELVMARSSGKAVVYDVAQKPDNLDLDDVAYQAKNHGFIFINTAQEGDQLRTSFNQFQQIDFTMSNALTQLINLKVMLEQTLSTLTGVTPSALGANPDAPVGTTEQGAAASSLMTQSLYHLHSKAMEEVMTRVTDYMKIAWGGRKKFTFPLGEKGVKFLELLAGEDLAMNDYSIFIKNSYKEAKTKELITNLSEAALRGGQIGFLELIKVMNADTAKEAEKVLERSIKATKELNEQIRQQEQQMQQAAIAQKAQADQGKLQVAAQGNQAKIEAAKIAAQGKIRAEEVEQKGKRDYEDHRFVKDIDRMAFQASALGEDPSLIELAEKPLGAATQSQPQKT